MPLRAQALSRPRRLRALLALALLAPALLLSGCVYLRLLSLKKQLNNVPANFRVGTADGVDVRLVNPVLKPGDIRWLGIHPASSATAGNTETWRARWLKEAPPGSGETAVYDLEIAMRFDDGRLARVNIPERYFAHVSKDLFLNLLRSAGEARVNKAAREAEVENTAEKPGETPPPPPGREVIGRMLGLPTRQTTDSAGRATYYYRYKPQTAESGAKPVESTFVFDATTQLLLRLSIKLPTGKIHFNFPPPPAK
ncbi:MAG: hypothetical protein LBM92_06020 [Opitutaceae bacterium]|jgi:hypothetical protein|nr:hypothetical protein [Opitutaceae bacterium]